MQKLAHYEIKHLIYQGAMGTVFEAFDTKLERTVALKVLAQADLSAADSAEALSEARFLARLNHPNIIQVFDCAEDQDTHFLVMEFCRGKNLLQYQKQHLLSLEQKLSLLIDIAKGLEHAHRNGIIHRDLKPSNILISESGAVKVADFGIAEFIGANAKAGASAGTQGYMAPEQILGQPLSNNSDWFSFCVLAIELLTGQHPYGGQGQGSEKDMARAICDGQFIDLNAFSAYLPQPLIHILSQGLAVEPGKRVNLRRGALSTQLEQILQLQVQQAIMAQQTEPLEAPAQGKQNEMASSEAASEASEPAKTSSKPTRRAWYYGLTFSFIAVLLVSLYLFRDYFIKAPVVAILPTQVEIDAPELAYYQGTLSGSIQSALWQQLASQNEHLVSRTELQMLAKGVEPERLQDPKTYFQMLADYTGASVFITSSASCQQRYCSIEISRLEAPDWQLVATKQWQSDLVDTRNVHESARFYGASLFAHETSFNMQDEQALQEQIFNYYNRYYNDDEISEPLFNEVMALLSTQSHFDVGYTLARELALQLKEITGKDEYLEQVQGLLAQAPRQYQRRPSYFSSRILLSLAQGKVEDASHDLAQLRRLGGGEAEYLNLQASWYLAQGEREKGRDALERSLMMRPNLNVQIKLASLLYSMGDIDSALSLLDDVLNKLPLDKDALQLMAVLALTQGDFATVIRHYEALIKESLDPKDVANTSILANLALAYLYVQQYQQAQIIAGQAHSLAPNNSGILLNYADALTLAGQLALGREYYQRVIDVNNGQQSAYSWSDRAQAYAHLGDYQRATTAINTSLELGQELADIHYAAAIVYAATGDNHSALYYVQKAMQAGYGANWFVLPWFKPLCAYPQFTERLHQSQRLCDDAPVTAL
ncbi:serine/threonine-protein kinase [Pseudoalteromonas sp. T1lg22]|uniref:serine/threonine-protein kinase n=1 Tax=Pseudoalteromonas sp. T1lg22 TaxID=2077096 RepID=UPI000CF5F2D5|nr:serine/threonine-protein kinase [Pseudoalteromonas sp. T1lg22]